jgi:hypothetical protein
MSKDWKDISDDEILNFDGSQTNMMARYERIMQKRSADALLGLRDKLTGLMETIYRASQGMKDKADEVIAQYNKATESQQQQQRALLILSAVVAVSTVAYTLITWQSVKAMREANDIQRELLLQKSPSANVVPNK